MKVVEIGCRQDPVSGLLFIFEGDSESKDGTRVPLILDWANGRQDEILDEILEQLGQEHD